MPYQSCFRLFPAVLVAVALLAGCAATDLTLKPNYLPVGDVKGKGGTVILATALDGAGKEPAGRLQWVLGEVKDSDGKVKGNIVSPVSPAAMVRDALQQELLRAGYLTELAESAPQHAGHAVVLTSVTMHLDETASLVKSEADCRVSFAVEIRHKGIKTNTLSFESRYSDFAMKDREKLHQTVVQKAFQSAFKRAVPAIVTELGK